MCIAIVKPKNTNISDEYLINCFENNPDGAGIAYTVDKKLYIVKGIFDVNVFIKAVREAEKIADNTILIHCRIGTSGLKDKNNCHPFVVNDNTVMIHNGILDIDVPKDSKISDTQIFVNEILKNMDNKFIHNKGNKRLLEYAIGKNNKFAFLDNKGQFVIINEEQGSWEDGIWYSNDSYSYSFRVSFGSRFYQPVSKKDRKKIKSMIAKLNDMDIDLLGDYPMWDTKKKTLVPEGAWIQDAYYLDEIDYSLQDEYEEIANMYKCYKYGGF